MYRYNYILSIEALFLVIILVLNLVVISDYPIVITINSVVMLMISCISIQVFLISDLSVYRVTL